MNPYPDQWQRLASIKRVSEEKIDIIIENAVQRNEGSFLLFPKKRLVASAGRRKSGSGKSTSQSCKVWEEATVFLIGSRITDRLLWMNVIIYRRLLLKALSGNAPPITGLDFLQLSPAKTGNNLSSS
jgi:hypothetical protein